MSCLADTVHTNRFLPLPVPRKADGSPRRVGIEIEFGGLSEHDTAAVIRDCLGGEIEADSSNELRVTGTEIGPVKVVLDTAFRKRKPGPLREALLDVSRAVVPVEIVTDPLVFNDLPKLDRLRSALRSAGAEGTRKGVFLGFGVHLNPEVAGQTAQDIAPVLRAYALLEDWLRTADPIDTTRRLLPFVDRYPRALVDALAHGDGLDDLDGLIRTYLELAPSRNHGLDMLPLIRHLDETTLFQRLGSNAGAVSGRPVWHFRLPDCRIDEDGWSLALAWNSWRVVECVAADSRLLDRLAGDWLSHDFRTGDWAAHVGGVLAETPDRAVA